MTDVDGNWNTMIKSPQGEQKATLTVRRSGDTFTGEFTGPDGTAQITDGKVDGSSLSWSIPITKPVPLLLTVTTTVEGDVMSGSVKAGGFGSFPILGWRA